MKDGNKGWFITFEGLDGSGKSTQIKMATDYLESKGYEVVSTVEPGGTPIGEKIRKILLDRNNADMCAKTEICLFLASRAQLVSQVIKPALREKKIVLCDRFFDSSVAYQGFARNLGPDEILELSLWATGGLVPDLTILLSMDISHTQSRQEQRGEGQDRLESQEDDFKRRVHNGYIELAVRFRDRFKVIDGNRSVDEVFQLVREKLDEIIG